MATTIKADFHLDSTDYDRGFGSTVRHTISTRARGPVIAAQQYVELDGSLSLMGIDLKPGQKITAVFTIDE